MHSYTSQQRLADVPAEDKRRGRAAAENIIPQASRSPAMLDLALPELAGRITGSAMNVPVRNGSLVDLVCWHEKTGHAGGDQRGRAHRRGDATAGPAYLRYEHDPIVSSDVAHSPFSSVFDSLATMAMRERVSKTVSWFDSGFGYAHRAIDLLERYAELDARRESARHDPRRHQRFRPDRPLRLPDPLGPAGRSRSSGINDLYDNDQLAYLLKYDTVMRVFDKDVSADADSMTVGGRRDPHDGGEGSRRRFPGASSASTSSSSRRASS